VTRVKICGVTRPDDAELAAGLGAWAIGMVFHRPSPRAVALESAERIGRELKRRLEVVGVFVNSPLDDVAELAELCSLTMLQLHGEEGPAYCAEVARRTGCKVMKAVRVRDASSLRDIERYRVGVDFHMLDAHVSGKFGGTGETFNWDLVARRRSHVSLVLSGGLTPGNVGEAIRATHPFAVDTASGTEAEPGRKDAEKVRAFFRAVEAAAGVAAA
jgi:phosphoribosylanthranilate isomerase